MGEAGNTPFIKLYAELQDARTKIDIAMKKAREGRGVALDNNELPMAMLFKEIEFILKNVLED